MKILIVDDEAHIRQMMRFTLEAAGYEVDEAADGDEGIAKYGGGTAYQAVLLDQKMPGLDGLETLRRIRERTPDARVIMVTAFASVELAVDAMKLGAVDFLRKPMTPETLRGAVAGVLTERPRRPLPAGSSPAPGGKPEVSIVTLNGFQIQPPSDPPSPGREAHTFRVKHFPDGTETPVTVTIQPEAVARVARLARKDLRPGGAFWRDQAERRLAAYLWTEGRIPDDGRLAIDDLARDDFEVAASWTGD